MSDFRPNDTHEFNHGEYVAKTDVTAEESQREVHGKNVKTVRNATIVSGSVVSFHRMSSDMSCVWFSQETAPDDITYFRVLVSVAQSGMKPV